jgi:type I restriction enzyme S subunit
MKENKIVKLSDVCDLIPGFAFKSSEFGEHKVKAVKIGDIQPPYVNFESMTGVDIFKYSVSRLAKYEIFKGDFVLAMTGATIGKIGRYISDTGAYINQRVLKFKPHDEVNSDFIYYVVSSTSFQKYILNNVDSETAQPNISAGSVGKYEFELPSLEEQNRIANILASIDNKIQLNRQINDNLEQQAQAAFNNIVAKYSECETINLSEIAVLNPKRAIAKGTLARSIEMAQLPTSGSFPAGWDLKDYNGGMKFQNGDTLMARIKPC